MELESHPAKLETDHRHRSSSRRMMKTLALMDGAKYQSCPATEAHLKALGFTVCISAPYSYTTAPIELAFGFIKSVDLNPRRQKVSKSKSPPTI